MAGTVAEPSGARASGEPQLIGLGLPIARRLAELHAGKLLLSSEPGKGITVRVSLPAHPPELPPLHPPSSRNPCRPPVSYLQSRC